MPTAMVKEARCRIGQEKRGGGGKSHMGGKAHVRYGGGGAKAYHGGLGGGGLGVMVHKSLKFEV